MCAVPLDNIEAIDEIAQCHALGCCGADLCQLPFGRRRVEKDLESFTKRGITKVGESTCELTGLRK